jgi:hypothetical protein
MNSIGQGVANENGKSNASVFLEISLVIVFVSIIIFSAFILLG